ncbi:hypothetical protein A6R68_10097 [Neotoma lepida]|uniref:Uncharacterized protein n=1 Tax=Neotoma lepida TaxID=56216 RepID=A0A1A6FYU5_NEOLE|nr:hypothetical protein A6R68_10097 [Neotoma lepida]
MANHITNEAPSASSRSLERRLTAPSVIKEASPKEIKAHCGGHCAGALDLESNHSALSESLSWRLCQGVARMDLGLEIAKTLHGIQKVPG